MNQKFSIRRTLLAFSIVMAAMLASVNTVATTCCVNPTAGSSPGSLRDAISFSRPGGCG